MCLWNLSFVTVGENLNKACFALVLITFCMNGIMRLVISYLQGAKFDEIIILVVIF